MTGPNSPWADPTGAGPPNPPPYPQPLSPPPSPPPPDAATPAFAPLDPGYTPYPAPQYPAPQHPVPTQPGPYGGYVGYGGYGAQPPAYPGPGMFQPTQAPRQTTNGMAVASMVVSIVGVVFLICYGLGGILGVVGAILGHVARRHTRDQREAGDGMALAGIIVGWIAAGLGVAIAGLIAWAAASFSYYD